MSEYTINEVVAGKVYDNQKQCSTGTGYPPEIIKAAKGAGCPGFHTNGRIHWDVAGPWIQSNLEDVKLEVDENYQRWKLRQLKAATQREELALEKDKGRYIDKDDVMGIVKALAQAQKLILTTRLIQELPGKLLGMTEPQMRAVMEAVVQEICKVMKTLNLTDENA